jgi:DNA-binding response OmpR family regulator
MSKKASKSAIPLPLTRESTDDLYTSWMSFAKTPESGSCYYHNKSDLLYRIHQLQTDNRFQNYRKNVTIYVIDAESLNIEDPQGWDASFKKITSKKGQTLILIVGLDHFLIGGDAWVFHYLMKKEIELKNAGIILFFTIDFLHPQFVTVFDNASTWIRKTIRFPLHTPSDTVTYLTHQATIWKMPLPEKMRQSIVKQTTGGYFLLAKEALRYLRDNPDSKDHDIIHHREIRLRVEAIWRQLIASEQAVMKKVVLNAPITDPTELHSLEFLTDTGWINKINGKYSIAITLLASYIQTRANTIAFTVNSTGKIMLNSVPIDGLLSKAEKLLLTLLVSRQGEIVSRDMVAETLDGHNEDYNDWSIDKAISRLRKKLSSLEVTPTAIKTVHGKGFRLQITLPHTTI